MKRAFGFSLIELLVALLVIVLLTSVVSLNVGSGGQDIRRDDEIRQFAAVMGYVQSEAELSGADHGVYFERISEPAGARVAAHWLRRYDQGWAEPRGSREVLAPFVFGEDVDLQLALLDRPDVEITGRDPALNPAPQLVFFAGGEVSEGELDWLDTRSGELLFRLRWDLFGRTTLMPRGQEIDAPTPR